MNRTSLDAMLAQTLEDRRLSRGERRAVGEVLAEMAPGEEDLAYLRSRAFDMARDEVVGHEDRLVLDWLEDVVKVLHRAAAPAEPSKAKAIFTPGDDGPAHIVDLLRAARRKVDVCVFTVTDDRIADALVDAHRRQVSVRVITDDEKSYDRGSDVDRLKAAGIETRMDRSSSHMHHKFALFDGQTLLTGSYNWTRSAASQNEENFLVIDHPALAAEYAGVFEDLWKRFGD